MTQRIRQADYVYRNKGDTLRVRIHRKENDRWDFDVFYPNGSMTTFSEDAGDDFWTKRAALARANSQHGPLSPITTKGTVVDEAWYRRNRRAERDHATRKKTGTQLDREIDEVLSRSPRKSRHHATMPDVELSPYALHVRNESADTLRSFGYQKLATGSARGELYEIYGDNTGSYTVRRTKDLSELATAHVADDGRKNYLTSVSINDPKYKRLGIGTALYNAIEKQRGRELAPSPTYQTDEAKAFWLRRTR